MQHEETKQNKASGTMSQKKINASVIFFLNSIQKENVKISVSQHASKERSCRVWLLF